MNLFVLIPFYQDVDALNKCKARLETQIGHYLIVSEDEVGSGFTANVNKGLKTILRHPAFSFETSVVVILNQDCELLPGALESVIRLLRETPKAGLVGIKQLALDGDSITHGGTLEAYPTGRHIGGKKSLGDCTESKKVPWVNFACVGIRAQVIQECGLLDETMFMFGSDSDYSYTARARGWECWYCAEAEAIHEGGASSGKDPKMGKILRHDMIRWRDKWFGSEVYRDLTLEVF